MLLAGACVAVASAVRLLGGSLFGINLPFVAYFPAVLVASVWGGFTGGTAALLASTIAAYLLFRPAGMSGQASAWAMGSFVASAGLLVVVGGALAQLVAALRASEERFRTLSDELGHRAKNGISVIQAIISQSARGAASVKDYEKLLTSRIQAMSLAQELISAKTDESAELSELVSTILAPFDVKRFKLDYESGHGPIRDRNLALTLALILHELATNAVKYGALSNGEGKVSLRSERRGATVELRWTEAGGPPVSDGGAVGFGTRLLHAGLSNFGGRGERVMDPDGVVCTLSFPA